jgi:hypothetical protein
VVVRATVPPPRPVGGERSQRRPQRLIVISDQRPATSDQRLAALRGAMLTDIPARPALADTETVAQYRDRLAPTGRAHQFPFATSFSASMFSA